MKKQIVNLHITVGHYFDGDYMQDDMDNFVKILLKAGWDEHFCSCEGYYYTNHVQYKINGIKEIAEEIINPDEVWDEYMSGNLLKWAKKNNPVALEKQNRLAKMAISF